jgi:hypothetical protein
VDWMSDLERKHGVPADQIVGKVYVLHYEIPQVVRSVSADYSGRNRPKFGPDGRAISARPIRHYVGWTQQAKPSRRISALDRPTCARSSTLRRARWPTKRS